MNEPLGITISQPSALQVGPPSPVGPYIAQSEKGAASGVASLDSESHLTASQVPLSVVSDSSASPKDIDSTGIVDGNYLAYQGSSGKLKPTSVLGVITSISAPSGSSATDCANFASALAALPATGGMILLPATGSVPFDWTNGITINKPCKIAGTGLPDPAWSATAPPTHVICTSGTATPVTITSSGVTLDDFALECTATTPTAGAGVLVSSGGSGCRYDIAVKGFYRNFDIQNGSDWSMSSRTAAVNAVANCLRIGGNSGDFTLLGAVLGNGFTGAGSARVPTGAVTRIEGGAQGIKISSCKMLANATGSYCIDIAVPDGVGGLDYLISNNSLEGFATAAVNVKQSGELTNGTLQRLQIIGNQMGTDSATAGVNVVVAGAAGSFSRVIIAGNQIDNSVTTPIVVTGVNGLSIGINESYGAGTLGSLGVLTKCAHVDLSQLGMTLVECSDVRQPSTGYGYGVSAHSGRYSQIALGALIGVTFATKDAHVIPFSLVNGGSIKSLSISVSTVGNGTAELGIYSDNGLGNAGKLLGSVSVSNTSTGIVTGELSTPLALVPGLYWLAYLDKSATTAAQISAHGTTVRNPWLANGSLSDAFTLATQSQYIGSITTLPATFATTLSDQAAGAPMLVIGWL